MIHRVMKTRNIHASSRLKVKTKIVKENKSFHIKTVLLYSLDGAESIRKRTKIVHDEKIYENIT